MPRSRDRHDRGIRGPLAQPHPWSAGAVPLRHRTGSDFFSESVSAAIARISRFNPGAFGGIEVGVDDVPEVSTNWAGDRIPMAAALESGRNRPARIVLYRRPIELRAGSSSQLRELVHRTIVDQLAALTGIPVAELDDSD